MKNVKRIASMLLVFSLILIPLREVDAVQPPLEIDIINTYNNEVQHITIDNGIYAFENSALTGRWEIVVKNQPESAKVYFGCMIEDEQYMSDTPSETKSWRPTMTSSQNDGHRIIIKIENEGRVDYYSLLKKEFQWYHPQKTPIDYKTIPEDYEFHLYAGYNSYAMEPYGDLNLKIDYVSDEEEKQQRFGSFIDKYVGAEDSVNFFDFSLCDSEGNTVAVPEEYQLPSIYRLDFPYSHYDLSFPVGGSFIRDFSSRRYFGNETKIYDITDKGAALVAVVDDPEEIFLSHKPSGTIAVVDSGPQEYKYLYYKWVDDTHIKICPAGIGRDSVLFMASYDRGGRYLSSTEPIAVPANLNENVALEYYNGYEFDVRQEPNAKKVRFFLWDSINRMEPICNSVEIELE